MNSQFKSAEEWLDDMFSNGNWVTADTVTLRGIQSNTMREAARIAVNRMSPMTIPDEFIDRVEKAILDTAIAIEKGEYKPV